MNVLSLNQEIVEIFNDNDDDIVDDEHVEEVEDQDDRTITSCRYHEDGFVAITQAGGCVKKPRIYRVIGTY